MKINKIFFSFLVINLFQIKSVADEESLDKLLDDWHFMMLHKECVYKGEFNRAKRNCWHQIAHIVLPQYFEEEDYLEEPVKEKKEFIDKFLNKLKQEREERIENFVDDFDDQNNKVYRRANHKEFLKKRKYKKDFFKKFIMCSQKH